MSRVRRSESTSKNSRALRTRITSAGRPRPELLISSLESSLGLIKRIGHSLVGRRNRPSWTRFRISWMNHRHLCSPMIISR